MFLLFLFFFNFYFLFLVKLITDRINKQKPGKGSQAIVTLKYKSFLTYAAETSTYFT